MTTTTFRHDNTQGYTDEQLTQLNAEWARIVASEGLTEDEWKHRQERLLRDFDRRNPPTEDRYRIYVDRMQGAGLELDGCWGSEYSEFDSQEEAEEGARHLHSCYFDCAWVVVDESTGDEVYRISSEPVL